MNYLFNDRNLVRGAVLSALNIVSSYAIARVDTDAKTGSGVVALTGPYTGQHDTVIDIQIIDGSGDSSQVSQPVFSGVGNGTMTDAAVVGLDAQDFTVTVQSLGTQTLTAEAPFQGATLEALATGTAGNLLSINVDATSIVRAATNKSLLSPLRAGTNAYTGTEWDFGAVALDGAGNIPDAAPRISFGVDPQVYRAFKTYDSGAQQWVYAFSPPPVRDVDAGAIVQAVSGTWGVAVTDGTTTENYTGTTLYDILSGIDSTSALITVETGIAIDKTPNGMAATDVSVWTRPLVLSINEDGSDSVKRADIDFAISDASPTERVTIKCVSAATVGAELWTVTGDVSGALLPATTGVAYSDGSYSFLIPVQLPESSPPSGDIVIALGLTDRPAGVQRPVMCVRKALLGPMAHQAGYRFVWKRKPPKDCVCVTTAQGEISLECLGVGSGTGGDEVAHAQLVLRKQLLISAVRGFIEDNTTPPEKVDAGDVEWINTTAAFFASTLALLDGEDAALTYPVVARSTVYAEGAIVANGNYRYINVQPGGGTTAGSAPTYTTVQGDAITDGTCAFVCLGQLPLVAYDAAYASWKTDAALLGGQENPQDYPAWTAGTTFTTSSRIVPTQQQDFYLVHIGYVDNAGSDVVGADAATGAVEPIWDPTPDSIKEERVGDDLLIKWQTKSYTDLSVQPNVSDAFYDRYRSQLNDVCYAAGIEPNFEQASSAGNSDCWHDFDDSDFWFESQDGLKPMQLNHPYVSCKDSADADGNPIVIPTKEFGCIIDWGCPEKLKENDTITITIDNVSGTGGRTYEEGDTISIAVAHQDPVAFTGGQTGDDTVTFAVSGSIDGAFPNYSLISTVPPARQNTHAYLLGDRYVPAIANGRFYQCITAGTSAGSPPTFATDRTDFADGTAEFVDMGTFPAYSEGGLSFLITQGGIPFELFDAFTFSAVGGHFKWRQDGGAYSVSPIVIGTTLLVDGLTVTFTGGTSPPSWAAGDTWSFRAEAINGPDQVQSPIDGRLTWTGSTTITITPADNGPVSRLAIFDHHIPSDAVIHLQGSDDNFGTTPTDITVVWSARDMLAVFDAVTRAKWRVTVDKGGDLFWMFLGEQMQPMIVNGNPDVGIFKKRRRLPGLGVRSGLGGDITHEVTSQESFEDFMAGVDYACTNDDRSFGVVINETIKELALVRLPSIVQEATELSDYQQANAVALRVQNFSLTVEPLP